MATIVAATKQTHIVSSALAGTGGTNYVIPVRVRGVCGLKNYTGGTHLGGTMYLGGTPAVDNNDILKLVVSNPASTVYFNYANGAPTNAGNVAIDQTVDLTMDGLASLTLTLDNIDTNQYQGDSADALIPVEGFDTYDGIWARVDTSNGEPFASYTTILSGGSRGWVFSAFAENVYAIKAEK